MSPETIRQLQNTPAWKSFERHVKEVIHSLNTLDGITFNNLTESAVEGKGRQLAVEKLRDILEPFALMQVDTGNAKGDTEKEAGLS